MELMSERWPVTRTEQLIVGAILAMAAIVAPLQLYLVALALFGLPHVLWEMNWARHTYQPSLPMRWWAAFIVVLLLQASVRLGAWAKTIPPEITMVVDVLTLALLAFLAATAMQRHGGPRAWPATVVAVAIGAGLIAAIDAGSVAGVLLVLAVIHNFTPLALVPANRRFGKTPAHQARGLLFTLPWLVAGIMLASGFTSPVTETMGITPSGSWMPNEATWLRQHFAQGFSAMLSGLVLSQCLHYYCVLRLLPSTLRPDASRRWRTGAIIVSAALSVFFMLDFNSARKLYAVAAGVHAWLELPLMLLLLSGIVLQPPSAEAPSIPSGVPT